MGDIKSIPNILQAERLWEKSDIARWERSGALILFGANSGQFASYGGGLGQAGPLAGCYNIAPVDTMAPDHGISCKEGKIWNKFLYAVLKEYVKRGGIIIIPPDSCEFNGGIGIGGMTAGEGDYVVEVREDTMNALDEIKGIKRNDGANPLDAQDWYQGVMGLAHDIIHNKDLTVANREKELDGLIEKLKSLPPCDDAIRAAHEKRFKKEGTTLIDEEKVEDECHLFEREKFADTPSSLPGDLPEIKLSKGKKRKSFFEVGDDGKATRTKIPNYHEPKGRRLVDISGFAKGEHKWLNAQPVISASKARGEVPIAPVATESPVLTRPLGDAAKAKETPHLPARPDGQGVPGSPAIAGEERAGEPVLVSSSGVGATDKGKKDEEDDEGDGDEDEEGYEEGYEEGDDDGHDDGDDDGEDEGYEEEGHAGGEGAGKGKDKVGKGKGQRETEDAAGTPADVKELPVRQVPQAHAIPSRQDGGGERENVGEQEEGVGRRGKEKDKKVEHLDDERRNNLIEKLKLIETQDKEEEYQERNDGRITLPTIDGESGDTLKKTSFAKVDADGSYKVELANREKEGGKDELETAEIELEIKYRETLMTPAAYIQKKIQEAGVAANGKEINAEEVAKQAANFLITAHKEYFSKTAEGKEDFDKLWGVAVVRNPGLSVMDEEKQKSYIAGVVVNQILKSELKVQDLKKITGNRVKKGEVLGGR